MIKIPATRIGVAALLVSSLSIAPLLDNGDALAPPENAPISAQAPQFRIQVQRGELLLAGHTSSLRHEQAILEVAESSFPDRRVVTQFEALGIVPDTWSESTVLILRLLQDTSSAEAIVSANEIRIRSLITDEPAWQDRFDLFRAAVPPHMVIDSETILVDPSISVSTICERAFESFELGPINFESSGVEFRSSAYPRLDRLIALANACQDSQIQITGHTDGSGDESWNKDLSLRRASAVGDYLVKGGIDPERLQVSGVGPDEPVADDSTRYGRSLNRRIEIEWLFKD